MNRESYHFAYCRVNCLYSSKEPGSLRRLFGCQNDGREASSQRQLAAAGTRAVRSFLCPSTPPFRDKEGQLFFELDSELHSTTAHPRHE